MKAVHVVLAALIGAAVAAGVLCWGGGGKLEGGLRKESAFARVMRTNTLRCGYFSFPPIFKKDPNTGHPSGFAVDVMDYFSQRMGIKVEWTEEITFGNWGPALQGGRFDAVCTPLFGDAAYSRIAHLTRPLFYTAIVPIVRLDETRFGTNLTNLNRGDVTIAVQEGNTVDSLVRTLFPKAKLVTQAQNAEYGALMQDLLQRKADAVLWDKNGFIDYDQANPGKVKILKTAKPIKVMPCKLVTLREDGGLQVLLDDFIEDMQDSGILNRLIDKWERAPGTYLRVAPPYTKE